MTIAVETTALTKVLQGVPIVNKVSLSIPQGTIYGIVGANGAGKTTLLSLLHGVVWPTNGSIQLFEQTLKRESAEMRQRVQYVGAEGTLYPMFTVRDLVKYASLLYEKWDGTRCARLLKALDLPEKRLVRQLSFGMKRQLHLVICLSAHPDLLLLDEPTNGLDVVVKKQFLQLILDEAIHDGTTVLMATHNLSDLERMADGLAVMYQGRVIADGMVDDLKSRVHTYQVIAPFGLQESLIQSPAILKYTQQGSVWTLVAEDPNGELESTLRQVANHVEIVPQSLEDVFTHLLSKEGYSRETILLA